MGQALPPMVPAVAYPAIEAMFNYNLYSQRPLIKQSLEKASGYMSYEPDTTETAPTPVGRPRPVLHSPDPRNALETGSAAVSQQLPFVSAFLARQPGTARQPIQDFYTEADKFDTAHADLGLALKHANPRDVHQSELLQAGVKSLGVKNALTGMNHSLQVIDQSDKMTNAEKPKYTDILPGQMVTMA